MLDCGAQSSRQDVALPEGPHGDIADQAAAPCRRRPSGDNSPWPRAHSRQRMSQSREIRGSALRAHVASASLWTKPLACGRADRLLVKIRSASSVAALDARELQRFTSAPLDLRNSRDSRRAQTLQATLADGSLRCYQKAAVALAGRRVVCTVRARGERAVEMEVGQHK